MAVFQCSVQKAVQNRYWTNRYFVDAADLTAAEARGVQIVAAERAVHAAYVEFISLRTSTIAVEKPSVFLIYPLQGEGSRVVTTVVPLTVCARVLLRKGPTRPDQKFLRGVVQASDMDSVDSFTTSFVNFVNTNYSAPLFAIPGLCSIDGEDIIAVQASSKIAQHQLTRGTRKKTQPIIPVS